MPTTPPMTPSTAWGACTKIVEAATKSCSGSVGATAQASAGPNWDALANSFASLSAALAWGSIGLAGLAIIVGFGWAKIVAADAKNEARTEAAKCAKLYIDQWLQEMAPGIVRTHVEFLHSTTISGDNSEDAADAIGNAAG